MAPSIYQYQNDSIIQFRLHLWTIIATSIGTKSHWIDSPINQQPQLFIGRVGDFDPLFEILGSLCTLKTLDECEGVCMSLGMNGRGLWVNCVVEAVGLVWDDFVSWKLKFWLRLHMIKIIGVMANNWC